MVSKSTRKRSGQSIVEMVVGLIVTIPVLLVLMDCAIVVMGVQLADANCRETARVVASGDPTLAQQRANSYIKQVNAGLKGMVSDFKLDNPGIEYAPGNIAQEIKCLEEYGGLVRGKVTVHTKTSVSPFLVKLVFQGKPFEFSSQHTFPFTYIVPRQKPVNE